MPIHHMKTISFDDDPHRKKHFDFFRRMDQPHFNICANIDITNFLAFVRREQLHFTPAIVYLLTRTANELPAFRQRIRGEAVIEHEVVHPSFTVTTQASSVFSFCTVPFTDSAGAFMAEASAAMDRMQREPNLEDEPGRDDYLFLSALPWISFTGISHAMHYSPADSVPRITWGKYFEQGERTLLPLSVQAHHALVDGRDVGGYFQHFQHFLSGNGIWYR